MTEPSREGLSQILTYLLASLGLFVDPIALVISLVIAIGFAVQISRGRAESRRKPFWSVILTSLMGAFVAAMIAAHFFPSFPTLLAVIAGGLLMSPLLNIYVGVMTRLEDRAEDMADGLIRRLFFGGKPKS